ncbi:MAG: DUF4199 domain-containing protein [Chitinophagales bacterium]
MEKKIMSHITKGIVISLVLIVLDLVAGFAGLRTSTWFRWIPLLILGIALIWACISFGSQMDNNVGFSSVFGHGFKTSVVIACITVVYTVISLTLIFPETKEIALDQARKQMEEQGKPEQVIDQGMEIARKGFMTFAILGVVVYTLLVGAIASLIGAAVTKKNPVTPFGNQP